MKHMKHTSFGNTTTTKVVYFLLLLGVLELLAFHCCFVCLFKSYHLFVCMEVKGVQIL